MMAEIQMVYREGYCDYTRGEYCIQCHTACAHDSGCRYYYEGVTENDANGVLLIPFGDCLRAKFMYKYKGWIGKRYDIEELSDQYNPHLDCMIVRIGGRRYECVKVVLDGKCIYNEYDEEGETE